MEMQQTKVAIIGAGLTGLCCARQLLADGISCQVFEADDRVGGRIVTDRQDGFLLDRGFQVFLTSYPEAKEVLSYEALNLAPFASGALVHHGGKNRRVVDAWRQPLQALWSARSPVVPLRDIPRIIGLRHTALNAERRRAIPANLSTAEYLRQLGFSEGAMQRFFRPFFGGVTLDAELAVPARYFLFLFEMFARGKATLPADGMQAIPEQIAASLPPGTLQLETTITKLAGNQLELDCGDRVEAEHVVVATEASAAARLLGTEFEAPASNSTTTVYYGADRSELGEPILLLKGDGSGPVNHVCFPSDVQSSYAPQGAALASVSVLGIEESSDLELDHAVRKQLRSWMSDAVDRWQLLRIDRIKRALPRISDAEGLGFRAVSNTVTLCGDHLLTPSIQGAMVAGRHAAEHARQSITG